MKSKYIFSLLALIFISGCSFHVKDVKSVLEITHYEENEKNIQLGKDLLFYNYLPGLAAKINGIDEDVAKNIQWSYFIAEADKKVTFKVTLNLVNPILKENKEKIFDYFTSEVTKNYQYHINNDNLFSQAIQFANLSYSRIEKGELKELSSTFNSMLIKTIDKEQFMSAMKRRTSKLGVAESRVVSSKQYYNQKIDGESVSLFVLNFDTLYPSLKTEEQITLVQNNNWEIAGFRTFDK